MVCTAIITMFIMCVFRAVAGRHLAPTEPVHDVSGMHSSTDAQTASQGAVRIH